MSTYAEKVNSLVGQVDADGNLPDGVEADEGMLYAVNAERRRRDTQASYTKGQTDNKALQAENDKLAAGWQADVVNTLSATDKARMDELKVQDPEAWREELSKLEEANTTTFQAKRATIKQETSEMTELEQRQADLDAHNAANPDAQITEDVIQNDIPPRIVDALRTGKSTFAEFLEVANKYITTPKAIQRGDEPAQEPNFAGARGGSDPTDQAKKSQSSDDYSKEIY